MTRTAAKALTLAAWVATALLVIASIVGFYRLSAQVNALQREREQLTRRYSTVRTDRDTLASHSILLKNSLIAYKGFTDKARRVLDGNCNTEWTQRCHRYLRYSELLNFHSGTLLARISAKTPGDYEELLRRYRDTNALITAVNWRTTGGEETQWTAISEEGQAYALWKLRRPAAARVLIDRALAKHGGSPIIVATHLKIRCALHDAPAAIQSEYATYRKATRSQIAYLTEQESPDRANSTQFNLDLFSQDRELASVCGYAFAPR